MAATERLASSTSKCATPTSTPQARNVVARHAMWWLV